MSTTELPPIDTHSTLGEIVADRPARARVLERQGLDYCCHGGRTLAEAAAAAGLDVSTVVAELAAVEDTADADVDRLPPGELIDHILATHHEYLHEELPLLEALARKVRDVHGERHPELALVARLVAAVRADLEPHLAKEERILFPAIRQVVSGLGEASATVDQPIRVMLWEHESAGDLLEELRTATGDYVVPDDGCASYRMLYERLESLEADTHRHIHLENNVLFPAVLPRR